MHVSDTAGHTAGGELELSIVDLGWEGEGVARTPEGRVVFVPGVLPGDRVKVATEPSSGGGPLRGALVELLEPSPERVEHPCPHAAEGCRSCPLGCWNPDTAAEWKREHLRQTLRRIGGIGDANVELILRSPRQWNYRDRIELNLEMDAAGMQLGYRGAGGALVPVRQCLLGAGPISDALQTLVQAEWTGAAGTSATLRLLLRSNGDGGVVAVLFITDQRSPVDPDPFAAWLDRGGLAGWQVRTSPTVATRYHRSQLLLETGDPLIRVPLGEDMISLSPVAFSQANTEASRELVGRVLERIPESDMLADLYGGYGPFALEHAKRGGRSEVFESNPDALHAGQDYAREHELPVLFHLQDLEKPARLDLGRFGSVVVDPPRSGLSGALIETLNSRGPARLLYISCHPAALARDCVRLSEYRPELFCPVDMFPGTPDLETVALLTRDSFTSGR